MELSTLACNACGADIELPDDARFVTCRYCQAKLEVRHTDGAAFTEVREAVQRVERKTDAMADDVAALRAENRALSLRNDLDDLERDWKEREQKLMNRAQDGTLTVPTSGGAFAVGAAACAIGLFVAGSTSGGEGTVLGVGLGVVGVGLALVQHEKAVRYQRAKGEYLTRKDELERRLAKARRPQRSQEL